jgi:hypothetical protein
MVVIRYCYSEMRNKNTIVTDQGSVFESRTVCVGVCETELQYGRNVCSCGS